MKVLIQSFSYPQTGYPEDKTGKGGGFVFDCRAIDAYNYSIRENKDAPVGHFHLTGLDIQISNVLDNDEETQRFFQAAWTMVSLDIAKCLRRGFLVMTVNFGCTAGQHRSVYLAERMRRKIEEIFPEVELELNHLEREDWPNKEKGA